MKIINKIEEELAQTALDETTIWDWADPEKLVGLVIGLRDELELRITDKAISKAKRKADRSFNKIFSNMKELPNFDLMLAVYFQSKRGRPTSIYSLRKWVDVHKGKSRNELMSIFEGSFELGQLFNPNDELAVFNESY
tara:strand:+ start:1040 stop:1453 length:414 start_codon:yes stop_codon:yes gene_type:complete